MKAAILYEAGRPLEIEELETPAVDDDDVLIKVAACGVCHTDLKVFGGHSPFTSPTILGHEVSGVIERVGVHQRDFFKEGNRVIVGMRYKCGRCRYCSAGRENLCAHRPLPPSYKKKDGTAVTRWNVGGFAQHLAVPGYMVFSLPDRLPLEESSLIGCRVTTAYSAVKHSAELEPGDSALVIGCGGIGLNTIQFLRCFGAFPIIAADLIEEKLLAARKFGATHTINASKEDPTEAARSITDGGVDKSFEAIGNTKTADQIIRATRPGGTAVIIGGLGRVPFTISDGRFTMNEIKVTGVASRRTNDVNEVLSMVREQRIEVQSLVTRKYSFEDINEALKELRQGSLLMGISLWN
jgi:D-arabinose 1-dehydrogenase-like Zn-dependent alcohol dehydrogenase